MALIVRQSGFDEFVGAAGSPLSAHVSDTGDTWLEPDPQAVVNFVLRASGLVQPDVAATVYGFPAQIILVPNPATTPADLLFTKPYFLLGARINLANVSSRERFLLGIWSFTNNTFIGAGFTSGAAGGVNPLVVPIIFAIEQGLPPTSALGNEGPGIIAGSITLRASDYAGVSIFANWTMAIYIDEYQIIMRWQPDAVVLVNEATLLYAYPPIMQRITLPESTFSFANRVIRPAMTMIQDDITAVGSTIERIAWGRFDLTPQEVRPNWTPLENLFIAELELDFQSNTSAVITGLVIGLLIPSSLGPYLIFPPTRYRDVEVLAAMLVIDNTPNPAALDLSIGVFKQHILPFTRYQLVLPTAYAPIMVTGGGNRGKLYLFSEVISYSFN